MFPDAAVKVYLDASVEERARRRQADHGDQTPLDELQREISERDQRDQSRAVGPLVRVPEATYIDCSDMTIDQVVERLAQLVEAAGE